MKSWLRAARRGTLGLGLVLAASLVFSPAALAQKGAGGLLPAGSYQFSSSGVFFSASSANASIFLDVSQNEDVAQPVGQPQTTSSETQVFLELDDFSTGNFTFACLLLDHPSDFTIDKALGSATLATTLGPSTPTCPFSQPLTSTIALNGTWTGNGGLATNKDEGVYTCGGYSAQSANRNLSESGSATLTATVGSTPTAFTSNQISLNTNSFILDAKGPIDPGCGPAGVGTGPVPAGKYHFFGFGANAFFGMPPFTFDQVSLFEGTSVSQPTGGVATSTHEFDLNVSLFDNQFNGFGCWIISPSDVVSSGLASATIQTTITATTPLCGGGSFAFGISYPMTVSATWTANGPLITVLDNSKFSCGDYTASTKSFVQSRGAASNATITMPDYLGNPISESLSGDMGSLTQVDQTITATGPQVPPCFISPG